MSLTVAGKLRATLVLTIAAFAVVGAISFFSGKSVEASMREAEDVRSDLSIAGSMRLANIELVLAAMDSIIDRNEGRINDERMALIKRNADYLTTHLEAAESLAAKLGMAAQAKTLGADVAAMNEAIVIRLVQLIERRADISAFSAIDDAIDDAGDRVTGVLADLEAKAHEELAQTLAATEANVGASFYLQLGTTLLAVTLVGLFTFLMSRSISRPIHAMTAAMRRLAAGEKDIAVPAIGRRDELGEMATAVQVFKDQAIERDALEKAAAAARVSEADAKQRQADLEHAKAEDLRAFMG
ncbi:HAMP domain-containing protein, partial [Jiella sonneratiae]